MKVIADLPKYMVDEFGTVYSVSTGKIIKSRKQPNGYMAVSLRDAEGKNVFRMCHRLVAETYLASTRSEGLIVNHKDLDKTNNHVSNLEWCTYQYNTEHYVKNRPEHASAHRREIEESLLHVICKMIEDGLSTIDIHEATGVPRNKISKLRTGALYSWVSCNYQMKPEPINVGEDLTVMICDMLEYGFGCKDICNLFEDTLVNKKSVNNIKYLNVAEHISKGYTWWQGKYVPRSQRKR